MRRRSRLRRRWTRAPNIRWPMRCGKRPRKRRPRRPAAGCLPANFCRSPGRGRVHVVDRERASRCGRPDSSRRCRGPCLPRCADSPTRASAARWGTWRRAGWQRDFTFSDMLRPGAARLVARTERGSGSRRSCCPAIVPASVDHVAAPLGLARRAATSRPKTSGPQSPVSRRRARWSRWSATASTTRRRWPRRRCRSASARRRRSRSRRPMW